jgi:probable addiction module antidote protein
MAHAKNKTAPVTCEGDIHALDEALKRIDQRAFMNALKPVVKGHGGFTAISRKAALNRTALYRMLSSGSDVKFSTLLSLLTSLGLRLSAKRLRTSQRSSRKDRQTENRVVTIDRLV